MSEKQASEEQTSEAPHGGTTESKLAPVQTGKRRAASSGPASSVKRQATEIVRCRENQQSPVCGGCRQSLDGKQPKRCTRCQSARYCSPKCQSDDWPAHKAMCAVLRDYARVCTALVQTANEKKQLQQELAASNGSLRESKQELAGILAATAQLAPRVAALEKMASPRPPSAAESALAASPVLPAASIEAKQHRPPLDGAESILPKLPAFRVSPQCGRSSASTPLRAATPELVDFIPASEDPAGVQGVRSDAVDINAADTKQTSTAQAAPSPVPLPPAACVAAAAPTGEAASEKRASPDAAEEKGAALGAPAQVQEAGEKASDRVGLGKIEVKARAQWEYRGDSGWSPYEGETQAALEAAYKSNDRTIVKRGAYSINLATQKQQRDDTGTERAIRRTALECTLPLHAVAMPASELKFRAEGPLERALDLHSAEAQAVAAHFLQSMPAGTSVTAIIKNFGPNYAMYMARGAQIAAARRGKRQEAFMLYHGTHRTDPLQVMRTNVDPIYAHQRNILGRGGYVAHQANYCIDNNLMHPPLGDQPPADGEDREFSLLVCRALLGNVQFLGSAESVVDYERKRPDDGFDTVAANSSNGPIYCFYDKYQLFVSHMIRFKLPAAKIQALCAARTSLKAAGSFGGAVSVSNLSGLMAAMLQHAASQSSAPASADDS